MQRRFDAQPREGHQQQQRDRLLRADEVVLLPEVRAQGRVPLGWVVEAQHDENEERAESARQCPPRCRLRPGPDQWLRQVPELLERVA